MTWQLGAFAILAAALAGGFAWYERTHPDARIVALVGTLAAFAALGRIAFAALPNIKPTTDIVLISGYALGGAPGFVVGAVAGLASNFFFGQGPWTPWQMAAWGLTGVLGAGLAMLTGRRIGRWPLALVCAVAGYCFAVIQDVGDWVTYSDHSLAALGVYVGKGTGFDFVHAGGCLLFALAFGPAMTHSVQRFAARLQVTWRPAGSVTAPFMLALLVCAIVAPAQARAASPTEYLMAAQNSDGGFGAAPGQASAQLFSGWAALGLAAEGRNPQDVTHGGASLLDYVRGAGASTDVGSLERTILVLRAAGRSAPELLAGLEGRFRGNGSVAGQVNLTAFAVLALRAAGAAPSARTIAWLVRQQNRDGGFSFATAGGGSDVDDTGAALQALAGAGGTGTARARAVGFVRRQQNRDGGLPSQPGASSNAQSTAWGVQGLLAAGTAPSSLHRGGAPSPLAYIGSLVAPDGHVRYSRASDQTPVWVTAQAMMALASRALPVAPVARAPQPHRSPRRLVQRARPTVAGALRHARRGRRRMVPRQARPNVDGWATAAGMVMALALAPVGAD